MALFRFADGPWPLITSARLMLRPPAAEDFRAWSALRERSRNHLTPWEPEWPADDLTIQAFRQRVKRARRDIDNDEAYPLLITRAQDQAIIGGITLGLVRRGVSQACTMGYWRGLGYEHQGYMTEAVKAAVGFAFGELRLSRVEAACLPANTASIRLLERVGFQREGLAPRYLKIAGNWADHLLYALMTAERRG